MSRLDAVLLESQAHRHGAVGIAVPATGTSVTYEGRRYAYGETTARGWPIGRAPPDMLTPPNDWTVELVPRETPRPSSEGGSERRRGRRRHPD